MLGMDTPTPQTRSAPAPAPGPVEFDYSGRLSPTRDLHDRPDPSSWFITFGFGKPAERTYTEVAFALAVDEQGGEVPRRVLDEVVRRVAVELYGTAWAFTYPPEQYEDAIARYGIRLRERVVVTSIEVYA